MDNEIEKKRIKRKRKIGIWLLIIGCIFVGFGIPSFYYWSGMGMGAIIAIIINIPMIIVGFILVIIGICLILYYWIKASKI